MSNLKIGTRLLIGFGVIVSLAVVIGIYALNTQRRLQELSQKVDDRDSAIQQGIQDLMSSEAQMRGAGESAILAVFLRRDRIGVDTPQTTQRDWATYREANFRKLDELQSMIGALESNYISLSRLEGWRKLRQTVKEAEDALRVAGPLVEGQFAAIRANNLAEASARSEDVSKAVTAYRGKLTAVVQAMQRQAAIGRTEVTAITEEARTSVFVVLLVTVTLAVVLATMIHRSITLPLSEFTRLVEKVGQGDLTLTIPSDRRDEIGDLGRSLDKMVKGLRAVASQIGIVSESLNSATAEIFASSQQQAAATSEQAAAVQQANATMSQLAQSGAQIADRAKQVATAAEATSTASATGLQSVRNTTSTMDNIRQQAEAVAENVIALSEKTQTIGD
ncbi:MAG: methyl-accepting chemotaxis protein, partial [Acidobacteria bacterium]|nr:methyl-accepting chemotaxis protein [Acidobacteriota bacterium]